ncbi:ABC transporter permease [Conexibacter sp. CPCC 206217]|uniref:ABC transporter permease n=1 Tax=Conexibacter sp. CPCC 206217 TaxID=3064574 RepID=UPI002715E18B|nr:ABC transporter permease subunit [Conexibacter sp. CPCC 206217]MDO8212556.1 ABC transporter permease subunit [Conexibacter sp. CPCC 206217]
MLASVFAKTLHDRRRSLAGWSAGLVVLTATIVAYWPSVRDNPQLQSFFDDLPEAARALTGGAGYSTPAGYLNTELFALMMPLLFLVVAIGMGSRAVAAEEERGTIDLLMSMPLTRRRMLLEKVAGGVAVLFALGLVLFASLALGSLLSTLDVPLGRLAQISLATVLVALPFGALALAIGCATGARGLALGLTSAAAVAAYMLNALAPLVDSLSSLRDLSPFAWYASDSVLVGAGLQLWRAALLVGVALLLAGVAALALERRDLRS